MLDYEVSWAFMGFPSCGNVAPPIMHISRELIEFLEHGWRVPSVVAIEMASSKATDCIMDGDAVFD